MSIKVLAIRLYSVIYLSCLYVYLPTFLAIRLRFFLKRSCLHINWRLYGNWRPESIHLTMNHNYVNIGILTQRRVLEMFMIISFEMSYLLPQLNWISSLDWKFFSVIYQCLLRLEYFRKFFPIYHCKTYESLGGPNTIDCYLISRKSINVLHV